jgi:hypothetical protein
VIRITIIAFVIGSGTLAGQTTTTLGQYERPTRVQISAGGNTHARTSSYGDEVRQLGAMSVSVQRAAPGGVYVRGSVWWFQSHDRDSSGYTYPLEPGQLVSGYSLREETTRVFAAVVTGVLRVRLPFDLVLEPMLGAGYAPYGHAEYRDYTSATPPSMPSPRETRSSESTSSAAFTLGVGLRWRSVVLEQHWLGITGVYSGYARTSYSPFTVGWRF